MKELFKGIAGNIALGVEVVATLIIAYGALEALVKLLIPKPAPKETRPFAKRRDVLQRFGVWLLLGLEFELAADIVRSAISPNWADIGQLGAIAAIRTFLNHFLEKDLENLAEPKARTEHD